MPIHVDVFENYLSTHPNQVFIQAISFGLRNGFWPGAVFPTADYPHIVDKSDNHPPPSSEDFNFIQDQWDIEVQAGWFSPLFGPSLLPEMVSMPIFAVLKPSGGLWWVTNHSYGPHSLNSLIPHENISGAPLDGLKQLGDALLKF